MPRPTLALLLLVLLLPALSPARAQVWGLVWSDEFDADGLPDPDRWSYDVGGHGWGNNELQYYTESDPDNARVENGHLIIEAHREAFQGNAYTSARLVSRGKGDWAYGRIEVRAKLPGGRGTWPAIWMLPTDWIYGDGGWPDNGEIDIMEHVGFDPGRIHGTVHTHAYNHLLGTQKGGSIPISSATEAFHLYAIEWSPRQIDFSVDGTVYFRYFNEDTGWRTWPFDHPFHLILNLAIGGNWGGAQGVDDSIFPVRLEVDYVRVYENTDLPQITFTPPAPVAPGGRLTLSADASVSQGAIDRVTFLQGDGVVGSVSAPPYTFDVDNTQPGCYRLAVRATDAQGWFSTTPASEIQIGDGACPQAPYLLAPHPIPGHIEAEYFDLGGQGAAYLDLDAQNQGQGIRTDEGVDIESTSDEGGGYNIGWTAAREWLAYTIHVQETDVYTLVARVASPQAGNRFQIEIDGEKVGEEVEVPDTGDWQAWTSVTADGIPLSAGLHTLRFRFLTGGINLNYLAFTRLQPTSIEPDEDPEKQAALGNYPNPFRGTTRIAFALPAPMQVSLGVFDLIGRRVDTLFDERRAAGPQEVTFTPQGLPPGLYLLRLHTPNYRLTHPMVYLGE